MKKKKIHKIDLWLGSAVLILMVIIVMIQVVSRTLGDPMAWTEEVARWLMIWVTFAGASYAFKNGGLIRVDFFIRKIFKEPTQRIINIIDMSLLGILFVYLGYASILYMKLVIRKHQTYQITHLPNAVIISALLIGSILCLIFSVSQIIQIWKREPESAEEVKEIETAGKEGEE